MRKAIYLLFGLLSIRVCADPYETLVGTYQIGDKISCNLEIKLFKKQDRNYYTLKIDQRLLSGEYRLNDQYVTFEGLAASEASSASNRDISAQIEDGQLLFQNYGNSMNPYTLFSECKGKYLILNKVSTQQTVQE
ncbi:hypothetical protein [Vibrio proteolyticus]